MKKIAFMFVAAALFAACGEKKAPAQEAEVEEPVVEEVASYEILGDTAVVVTLGEQSDTLTGDSILAVAKAAIEAAAPAEEAAEEAPAAEETAE